MADRKKLSGAQNRKRKIQQEKYLEKQSGSLKKYLFGNEPQKIDSDVCEETPTESASGSSNTKNVHQETETQHYEKDADKSVADPLFINLNFNDPATWTNVTNDQRQILVKSGPHQIKNIQFPYDNNRRRFSPVFYKRELVNGECVFRSWLLYSETKDAVLERLVRVFSRQNIAFRGTQDKIFTPNNGNFLKMIEYTSLFDPIMNEHIRKIQANEIHTHYLGKNIQNELINLLATAVKKIILDSVKRAKYYSIILDCTPDVSHVEQMTMIVRFVDVPDNDNVYKSEIREHFLGFITLTNTSGASLTEKLLSQLNELSLPLENLRGQGYDNGSNMKGKNSGVQKRILDENPRAFFVACSSHSLNLVVNDAVKCCLAATSFFFLVQNIYVFFSASTQRWSVLLRHMPNLTLKPLSDTRWESRIDALRPLRYQFANILDALIDISEDEALTGPCGNQSRFEAQSLAEKMANFKFIASLIVWYNILNEVNLTSKQLQTKEYDMNSAAMTLTIQKKFLKTLELTPNLRKCWLMQENSQMN